MRLALVGRGRSTRSAMGEGVRGSLFLPVEGERNRWSSSGQRFAPRPSAADCPAEDHRSLSLQELGNSLTLSALRAGPALCPTFPSTAPLVGHCLWPPRLPDRTGHWRPQTEGAFAGGWEMGTRSAQTERARGGWWKYSSRPAPIARRASIGPQPCRREEGSTVPRRTVCR